MTDALIVLDVDGVISPIGPSQAWPDFRRIDDAPYWLLLSRAMGDALARLPARRAWLTTWDRDANEWVGPNVGWDPLPVLTRSGDLGLDPGQAKLAGLDAFLAEGPRPHALVWCEDELADPRLRAQAADVLGDLDHRLLAPDPRTGLTPGDVDRIAHFLTRPPRAGPSRQA